jgi:hypothetical protein
MSNLMRPLEPVFENLREPSGPSRFECIRRYCEQPSPEKFQALCADCVEEMLPVARAALTGDPLSKERVSGWEFDSWQGDKNEAD